MSRPPSCDVSDAPSFVVDADTIPLASTNQLNPNESIVDEFASATLPGESLQLPSSEPATNLGSKAQSYESVSSLLVSGEFNESFDEQEDEVQDFLQKVRKSDAKGVLSRISFAFRMNCH
jgi:hypothetical protein